MRNSAGLKKFPKMKKAIQNRRISFRLYPHGLSAELVQCLLSAGIFPSLLGEIAASSYSNDDLSALLAWVEEENHRMSNAALFIVRLRAGAIPPEQYYRPACPDCGLRGRHAEGCYRRYIDGEFGEYIKH
jgi:hypothetical protein